MPLDIANHNRREYEDQTEEEEVADGLDNFTVRFKTDLIEGYQAAHADKRVGLRRRAGDAPQSCRAR